MLNRLFFENQPKLPTNPQSHQRIENQIRSRTGKLLRLLLASVLLFSNGHAFAHGQARSPDGSDAATARQISFPDTADALTLSVDLHTHSVFSDGHVWPGVRVGEALKDGLDALAITEHLEWQPHLEDIPHPDRNRAFELALEAQPDDSELILIAGSEITRRAPHGHMNAVFISDANALVQPGTPTEPFDVRAYYLESAQFPAQAAIDAANEQGSFVFWNHSWSDFDNNRTEITDFHRQAAAEGKLHGIEIANGATYSPESFQLALDHGLTPIGVSDVHNLIDWDYEPHNGGHRPVNLVFTQERSAEAIRTALFEGQTVVWFKNLLIGRGEYLQPLLNASLRLTRAAWRPGRSVLEFDLSNRSDAAFELKNLTGHSLVRSAGRLVVPPHATETFLVRVDQRQAEVLLEFEVGNALTAPGEHPTLTFLAQPPPE